jgi:hypothetical protein
MTHNRSNDAVRDPWRASLRASRDRRAAARSARRWSLRRRSVTFGACAVMALGGGVAAAGNGGTTTEASDQASASSVTLKPGSRGSNVKRLQRKLRVTASGYYGSLTKRAVKRYQRRAGLRADGIAGPATLARLRIRLTPASAQTESEDGSNVSVPAELERIAQCESGGNPRAVSPDGRYRGKYQFDRETWRSLGGSGDPAAAPESEQDRLAVKLYRQRGTAPWPNCG